MKIVNNALNFVSLHEFLYKISSVLQLGVTCSLHGSNLFIKKRGSYSSAQWAHDLTLGEDTCLDFWAKDLTSKIEVKIRACEVKSCAYESKIRRFRVKCCAYKVKICACKVKISAYEVKSRARKSRHGFLSRLVR